MKTTAYVYKWTELSTGKWYIGSRTRQGCHPGDGYICSSGIVKPLIIADPTKWKHEILETGTPKEMRELEAEILLCLDAAKSEFSYNRHNCDGKFIFGKEYITDAWLEKNKAAGEANSQNPEWRRKNKAAAETRSQSPSWIANRKRAAEKIATSSEWRKNVKLANQIKAKDPKWLEKNKAAGEANSQNPEWRANVKTAAEKRKKDPIWRAKMIAHAKPVLATCTKTGATLILTGKLSIKNAGFDPGNVSSCCHGRLKTHKGYTFQFVEKAHST